MLLLVLVLAFFSDNLALFWILAELTTILSAMLVAILSARENIDAAIKYIFIASASMLFSFVGLIFLFETSRSVLGTGTLNWTILMQHAGTFPAGMMVAAFALVFIGYAAKSGIFPFHTWLPDAHAKAPSAVSAILSAVLLNVGIYGIIRVYAIVHQTPAAATLSPMLALFGFLTVGIAALSMLPQKNLKKLIAFSSIENMGILLIGIALSTPVAIFWVLFHIMAHSLTKASLFFSSGILHRQYRSRLSTDTVDDIRDVFRFQPLAAWGIIIGGLAIIGTPFFPLFFSEVLHPDPAGQRLTYPPSSSCFSSCSWRQRLWVFCHHLVFPPVRAGDPGGYRTLPDSPDYETPDSLPPRAHRLPRDHLPAGGDLRSLIRS